MKWFLLALAVCCSCELFFRLPIMKTFSKIGRVATRSLKVLQSSSISDHRKEIILPRYSLSLGANSLLALFLIVLVFVPFIAVDLLSGVTGVDVADLFTELGPIVFMTVVALVYIVVRVKFPPKDTVDSGYGATARFLHQVSLGSNAVCEMLFDIEKARFSEKAARYSQGHDVFVCGLARSGTTILMRALHETNQFATLTYRDMPFVMAPNSWAGLSSRGTVSMQKKTRAHDDGIMVDYDSPEAFEEAFWRVFAGSDYICHDRLLPHQPSEETLGEFRSYLSLIKLRYRRERYLSKNNNNILRLKGIAKACPDAIVLIPFREPLSHAYSLLRQHRNFTGRHKQDKFSEKYMSWLVHHEFGLDHRPFGVAGGDLVDQDPDTLDYWLSQWIAVYSYLLDHVREAGDNAYLVAYEDICSEDGAVWRQITRLTRMPESQSVNFASRNSTVPEAADSELARRAGELYSSLVNQSRDALGRVT